MLRSSGVEGSCFSFSFSFFFSVHDFDDMICGVFSRLLYRFMYY